MTPNPSELVSLLKGHRVWIQTHNFPDPDAIASAYGLQEYLAHFDVPAKICYKGNVEKLSVAKMIESFNIELECTDDAEFYEDDYVVLIDGQKYNSNMLDIPGIEVACIDHHPTFIECEYEYKDVQQVGACATIIASYFNMSGINPSINVASALSYGIKMDTDSFNRGVHREDLKMYDFLYELSDHDIVSNMLNNTMELEDLKAYGAAINNISIYDFVGIARIPFACDDALVAMVSDFILKLDVVTVAIIYSERANGLKFSVRSEEEGVHSGNLISEALEGIGDGGGHFVMAGGFAPNEALSGNRINDDTMLLERFMNVIKKMKI